MTRPSVAELLRPAAAPKNADVVIIGGGITGLALARELAAAGIRDTVIVERGYPGSGATGRNVARIRAMQLTESLSRVAVRCQAKYDRMGEELGFNVLFYRLGYAWVLYEDAEVERMLPIVEMHHGLGIRSRLLTPEQTLRRLPILRGGDPIAGSVMHDDAIVHHDAVVWAHLEHLAGRGPRLLSGTSAVGLVRGDAGVVAVETTKGRIETRNVVNATDGWSGEVNALAGVRTPSRAYRREVLVTAPIRRSIDAAITFYLPVEGWFNQTLRGEIVMGVVDPQEPAGINQASSIGFLQRTAAVMMRKAPALGNVTVIRQWGGMYDVSPDHLPLVGPTRQLEGWWHASGWSGRGMLLAPYLSELLAGRIAGRDTHPDLDAFDPDRFGVEQAMTDQDPDYYARYDQRH